MKPWRMLGRAVGPDGVELALAERDGEWIIRAAGHVLMSSRAHASEEALARQALSAAASPQRVLLGGLGLGYTLRAALDALPASAEVVVAELVPDVVAWVRGPVAHLAARPLDDPRVRVRTEDVAAAIRTARRAWDAVLLDVDNGPSPLAHPGNRALYDDAGTRACHRALAAGGVLGVWSARPDPAYVRRLRSAGFSVGERAPTGSGGRATRHVLVAVTDEAGRLVSRGSP